MPAPERARRRVHGGSARSAPPARLRLGASVLLLLLLAVSACAERPAFPNFRGQPAQEPPILVNVRNQNFSDVTIHFSRDGAWQRLGMVTGNSAARLEVPTTQSAFGVQVRFRVHGIGMPDNSDFFTDLMYVDRGSVVELVVAPVLSMSSWSIRD